MVTSINLPNLTINGNSRTSSSSILSPSNQAISKVSSPSIYKASPTESDNMIKEGRALERAISGGDTKKKSLGLTSTLNALLSRPNHNSNNSSSTIPTISSTTSTSTTTNSTRPTSDNSSGLLPLRGLTSSNSSSSSKQRSHSAAPTSSRKLAINTTSPGVLISPSNSQSGVSRLPSATASVLKSFLPNSSSSQPSSKPSSRLVSPVSTPHNNGISTPLPNQSMGGSSRSSTPALHTLEESYVGKVTARLGEAVNKVFLINHTGLGGVEWNKMNAPKYLKAREVGEMILSELIIAQEDTYLLRTLLRSSVLKSLSLFLSRLTTLLLPPTSYPPLDLKDIDNFPLPLKYNLEIVRTAFELKEALRIASTDLPSFVGEILNPWIAKFEELMAKVMGPVVIGLRITVAQICAKGREEELIEGSSTIAKVSVGRSLSIGRAVPMTTTTGEPQWIKDLALALEATGKLLTRLECGRDTEKWLVSVGTCAVWKGMLALSSRKLSLEVSKSDSGSPLLNATTSTTNSSKGLFKSTPKTSPSLSPSLALLPSGLSPQLNSQQLPNLGLPSKPDSHLTDLAFIRLLSDLELFESRLNTFVSTLNHPCPTPDILMSGKCDESLNCGLCKTGRTFDAESTEEEEEEGTELAQCAMREAMQALSAMVIVIRASSKTSVLKDALLFAAGGGIGAVSTSNHQINLNSSSSSAVVVVEEVLKPMTPFALLSIPLVLEEEEKKLTLASFPTTSTPACPTLAHALDTLPNLILLHLLISRLPNSYQFRLPHEIWELEYKDYAKELRGFAAAEEWTEEIGWELSGEISRVKEEGLIELVDKEDKEKLSILALAIRTKVNIDVVEV